MIQNWKIDNKFLNLILINFDYWPLVPVLNTHHRNHCRLLDRQSRRSILTETSKKEIQSRLPYTECPRGAISSASQGKLDRGWNRSWGKQTCRGADPSSWPIMKENIKMVSKSHSIHQYAHYWWPVLYILSNNFLIGRHYESVGISIHACT